MTLFTASHGMTKTPEYRAWASMRQRCANPKSARYDNYGGRGISVCDRWQSFEAFFADMGPRPTSEHSIDRIDNDGNYEPGNCHWATRSEQQQNKRAYPADNRLKRGAEHWTARDPERAREVARRNIAASHKRGSANNKARLTEADVLAIKARITLGDPDTAIAPDYGVRPGTIWFIRTGKHWGHVHG